MSLPVAKAAAANRTSPPLPSLALCGGAILFHRCLFPTAEVPSSQHRVLCHILAMRVTANAQYCSALHTIKAPTSYLIPAAFHLLPKITFAADTTGANLRASVMQAVSPVDLLLALVVCMNQLMHDSVAESGLITLVFAHDNFGLVRGFQSGGAAGKWVQGGVQEG